jgi:SAM-dependent methyltransferase
VAKCPLSGSPGRLVATRQGADLLRALQRRGAHPNEDHRVAYYEQNYERWHCQRSGLTWFSPAIEAAPSFYEFLSRCFSWYYASNRWDHRIALSMLQEACCRTFIEVGCGPGSFLRAARSAGIAGIGVESNVSAAEQAAQDGLEVFSQASDVTVARTVDALVLLQVLEHWCDPVATLRTLIAQLQPRWLLVSVPVSDSLLGVLSDPLVWPPHHQTLWSARALRVLGRILAAREIRQEAEPLTLSHFSLALSHEPAGAQTVLPQLGSWAGVRTRFILGRATGQSWSRWAHTRTALYRLR